MSTQTIPLILLIIATGATGCTGYTPTPPKGTNTFQMITGSDPESEKERWNAHYKKHVPLPSQKPEPFIQENLGRLLRHRKVLLYPLEDGTNAIFLAKNGLEVTGIDYSELAIQHAKRMARESRVRIQGVNADLNFYNFPQNTFEAVVAVDFYRPRLVKEISNTLKPGGLLLYIDSTGSLKNNFKTFEIVSYFERKNPKDGRMISYLIAKKRDNQKK